MWTEKVIIQCSRNYRILEGAVSHFDEYNFKFFKLLLSH